MLKKRVAHKKYAGKSDLPVHGIFTRKSEFKQIFVQVIIEEESDEEEEDLEESDDEVFYSDSDYSGDESEDETDMDGNF